MCICVFVYILSNKKWNSQGSKENKIKTLSRSESEEIMNIDTDIIIANLKFVDIYNKEYIMCLWSRIIDKADAYEAKLFANFCLVL